MITFMALFNGKFDYKQVVSGYTHAIESTWETPTFPIWDWADWNCYGLLDYCTETRVCNKNFTTDSAFLAAVSHGLPFYVPGIRLQWSIRYHKKLHPGYLDCLPCILEWFKWSRLTMLPCLIGDLLFVQWSNSHLDWLNPHFLRDQPHVWTQPVAVQP